MAEVSFLKKNLNFLYLAVAVVYIAGLFVPLMENDSAQHASMAMKMVLNNDFLHIYKGNAPYLDKPHLHFWLAALSMKLFGINHVAYRIPALLFLVMGAVCTFKLTLRLYKKNTTAHVAAVMFLVAQTIVLSGHDVRTDAILTGAVILSIYNLVAFIQQGKTVNILLGGLGAALALGSKGMIGVGIIVLYVLSYLLYSREWKGIFKWKTLLGLVSFAICITPILYAYYVQFDLHPEIVIHGHSHISGVRFILWDQSFNRFSGEEFGKANPDYFFFFHTVLWVFLPFSILLYGAVFSRTAFFIKTRFRKTEGYEFLTIGGFWAVMLVFSSSKFKLPHYLNSLVPMMAVLSAAYLVHLYEKTRAKETRLYLIINYIVIVVGTALMVYLGSIAFHPENYIMLVLVVAGLFLVVKGIFSNSAPLRKLFYTGVLFAATLNLYINTQFYPPLTQYQAGLKIAGYIKEHRIDPAAVMMPETYKHWTLDFYTASNIKRMPEAEIISRKGNYLFIGKEDLDGFKARGLACHEVEQAYQYRITALTAQFLNPETRQEKLKPFVLVQVD